MISISTNACLYTVDLFSDQLLYTCNCIEVNKILFTLALTIVETHEMVILTMLHQIKAQQFYTDFALYQQC